MTTHPTTNLIYPVPINGELSVALAAQPLVDPRPGESDIHAERRRRRAKYETSHPSVPASVRVTSEALGGVSVRRYSYGQPKGTLLWLHGGGWVFGESRFDDSLLSRFAREANVEVVAVDYRLAPEHPYPAAMHDTLAVVHTLRQQSANPMVIAGASAGATIGAGLALQLRDRGELPPRAVMLICPPLHDESTDEDTGPLNRSQVRKFWELYLGGQIADEYAAPARATSLHGFPAAYIYTTSADPLRLEGWRFAERLAAAGTEVTARFMPGGYHGFEHEAPEAVFSQRAVTEWINYLLNTIAREET